jgi:hypothetical protein
MAQMNLQKLIRIAPLSEETRKKLLSEYGSYNLDQKFELSRILWLYVAEVQSLELSKELDRILDEVRQKKRQYNVNDFQEAKAQSIYNYDQKIQAADTDIELEGVRQNLAFVQKTPTPTP